LESSPAYAAAAKRNREEKDLNKRKPPVIRTSEEANPMVDESMIGEPGSTSEDQRPGRRPKG